MVARMTVRNIGNAAQTFFAGNQKLIDSGAVPVADTPAQFGKFLKEELERWGKVVRDKGIKEPG